MGAVMLEKVKIKDTIKNMIIRHGTNVTVNSQSQVVLLRPLSSSEIKSYLDDIESMAVIKPALFLIFPYDTTITDNNTFVLNNRSYIIRKVTPFMCECEIIYKSAIGY